MRDWRPVKVGASTSEDLPTSVRVVLYGMICLALKIIRALQLLLEVSALRRGGEGPRFALCLRLELLKLILKLMLRSLTPFAFYCDEQSICQALGTQKEKQVRLMQVFVEGVLFYKPFCTIFPLKLNIALRGSTSVVPGHEMIGACWHHSHVCRAFRR